MLSLSLQWDKVFSELIFIICSAIQTFKRMLWSILVDIITGDKIFETMKGFQAVSAKLKVVHIGPKHVHIGHVLVQTTPRMGKGWHQLWTKISNFQKFYYPQNSSTIQWVLQWRKKFSTTSFTILWSGILTLSKVRLDI